MRWVMNPSKEKLIKNLNFKEKICKTCEGNNKLKEALIKSTRVPIQPAELIFADLSLKGNKFKIVESAKNVSRDLNDKIIGLNRKADVAGFLLRIINMINIRIIIVCKVACEIIMHLKSTRTTFQNRKCFIKK